MQLFGLRQTLVVGKANMVVDRIRILRKRPVRTMQQTCSTCFFKIRTLCQSGSPQRGVLVKRCILWLDNLDVRRMLCGLVLGCTQLPPVIVCGSVRASQHTPVATRKRNTRTVMFMRPDAPCVRSIALHVVNAHINIVIPVLRLCRLLSDAEPAYLVVCDTDQQLSLTAAEQQTHQEPMRASRQARKICDEIGRARCRSPGAGFPSATMTLERQKNEMDGWRNCIR